jgi:hypothetical protein
VVRTASIIRATTDVSIIKAITDDEGSANLWNVGLLLRNYTARHPRRLCHLHDRRGGNLKPHSDVTVYSLGLLYVYISRKHLFAKVNWVSEQQNNIQFERAVTKLFTRILRSRCGTARPSTVLTDCGYWL